MMSIAMAPLGARAMDDLTDEGRRALAFLPKAKELMAMIKKELPEGTHFGLMILEEGTGENGEDRLLALSTDRKKVALQVARWVLDALDGEPVPEGFESRTHLHLDSKKNPPDPGGA